MRNCKMCGKRVATGKSIISYTARKLGYCLYCYKGEFPRYKCRLPPLRQGSERLLSWSERIYMEKAGFNPAVWSPEFRREMMEYWEAKERGELL